MFVAYTEQEAHAVETYTTKPFHEKRYEIHHDFVDVQFVLKGEEYIHIVSSENLTLDGEFDKDKDIGFFKENPESDVCVRLRPGMYCVIFPWEAHKPCISVGNSGVVVEKCVKKIPVEEFMRTFSSEMFKT